MFNEFVRSSSYYYRIFVILISFIVFSFLVGFFTLIGSKNILRRSFAKKLLVFSVFLLVVTYITYFLVLVDMPEEIDFKPEREYNFTLSGSNTNVEISSEEKEVTKKLKSLLESGFLNNTKKFTKRDTEKIKVAPIDIVMYSFPFYYYWKTIKLRSDFSSDIPHFSKTYDLSENDYSWKEELVKFSFGESSNMDNKKIMKQFKEIDDFLKKKKMYLTDVHENNVRVTENGDIKIIDGELLSKRELLFFQLLNMRGNKKSENMDNIYFTDGTQIYF